MDFGESSLGIQEEQEEEEEIKVSQAASGQDPRQPDNVLRRR